MKSGKFKQVKIRTGPNYQPAMTKIKQTFARMLFTGTNRDGSICVTCLIGGSYNRAYKILL